MWSWPWSLETLIIPYLLLLRMLLMLNHLDRGRGRRDVRWLRRKPDIVNMRRGRRRCSFDWGRRGRDYGSCRGGAGRLLSLLLLWLGLQIILVLWRIPVGGDLDIVLRLKWEKLMVLKWTFRTQPVFLWRPLCGIRVLSRVSLLLDPVNGYHQTALF